jgi:hypothetical protein
MRECRLFAYRLAADAFRPHEVGGYSVADQPMNAIDHVVIDDLVGRHARAGRTADYTIDLAVLATARSR